VVLSQSKNTVHVIFPTFSLLFATDYLRKCTHIIALKSLENECVKNSVAELCSIFTIPVLLYFLTSILIQSSINKYLGHFE
jgi:uncharacterized membrane protein (DUF106 family)